MSISKDREFTATVVRLAVVQLNKRIVEAESNNDKIYIEEANRLILNDELWTLIKNGCLNNDYQPIWNFIYEARKCCALRININKKEWSRDEVWSQFNDDLQTLIAVQTHIILNNCELF